MFDKVKNALGNAGELGSIGDIKQYAEDLNFPASKDEVVSQLQTKGADDGLISKVKEIGQDYFSDQNDFLSTFMTNR
ncbi:MAG: DUF2795 domain-containing protein [Chloroflexia bacterium]|jgi:hypothetical protein|nr:DUF2795 domain-containing protein [Chloroflexia bacterium]MDQ3614899.1 DUF2795 domain-containing protein [Chloroflexota bacterium]